MRWKNFLNMLMLKKTRTNHSHVSYVSAFKLSLSRVTSILYSDNALRNAREASVACRCAALQSCGNAFLPLNWHACVHFHSVVNVIGNQFAIIYRAWQRPIRPEQLMTGFRIWRLQKRRKKALQDWKFLYFSCI